MKGLMRMVVALGLWASFTAAPADGAVGSALGRGGGGFDRMVVFGDSLSDMGNVGRFSDGPVWVEVLADRLGLTLQPSDKGGTNYAHGGARLHGGPNSLRRQADIHLAGLKGKADPDTLYVVYGGGNDLLAAPWAPNRATLVRDAVAELRSILEDLAAKGARTILVPNVPDIGHAPQVNAFGKQVAALGRALSMAYNQALDASLDAFANQHPQVRLVRMDVFGLAEQVMDDPTAAGFRNATAPCPDRTRCDGYLFWDTLHPTAAAHAKLADAALESLALVAEVGR